LDQRRNNCFWNYPFCKSSEKTGWKYFEIVFFFSKKESLKAKLSLK
jgi:hypothetical protein